MRLSVRRKVDLPQPDGPMKAVTLRGLDLEGDALDGEEVAVVDVEVVDFDALGHEIPSGGSAAGLGGEHLRDDARDEVEEHDDDDEDRARTTQARSM